MGFASEHLVSFGINPRLAGYQPEQAFDLYKRVDQTLAALPGTRNVGGTDDPDLVGTSQTRWGHHRRLFYKEDENKQVEEPAVTPGYFSTLQIPLLAGRTSPTRTSPANLMWRW